MTTHVSTHVTTQNPVRTDLATPLGPAATTSTAPRAWALAGIGAGVTGIGAIVASGAVDAVYDPDIQGDASAIADKLATQTEAAFVFHSLALACAVLLVVFAAGLLRRMRATDAVGSAPTVAFAGLLATSVVSVIGTSLDTEFLFGLPHQDQLVTENVVMYGHWIGTVPWCWVLAGLSGLALHVASRSGGVPRWLGRVGLVLGGLTVLVGISPLQYLAGMTGPVWLLVTALGFVVGDKAFRAAR